ncbi:hypothetical protein FOZ62_029938, partial [Perkinsus olseni]
MWVKTGCRVPAYGTAQYLVRLRATGVSPITNQTGVVWSGQGSHTDSVSLKITTNNTLEAVVGGGCGEISGLAGSTGHISLSGQCLDWMHIALAWDALAPGSNMEVYVNGRRTGVSYSHRVSGFCFDNLMTAADYAGAELAFGDGNWSMNGTHPISGLAIAGVRMYSRRLNASEVASLMSSERPSCSYAHDDCPDISSSMVNARSIAYGSAVSNETRFPLHWRTGGNWAHYGCIPGYTQSSGDTHILCNMSRPLRVSRLENVTNTFTTGSVNGFKLDGGHTRVNITCRNDSTWSAPIAHCSTDLEYCPETAQGKMADSTTPFTDRWFNYTIPPSSNPSLGADTEVQCPE